VSLLAWKQLELDVRQAITRLGSQPAPDADAIRQLVLQAVPDAIESETFNEPNADRVPSGLSDALSARRPLSDAAWSALQPVDRFALAKVASRGKAPRLDAAYREIVGRSGSLSHLNRAGDVRMVGIEQKGPTVRRAEAESTVSMNAAAFAAIVEGSAAKGDVLATARVAGIMAAKKTADLIPLCHPLSLTHCEVGLRLIERARAVHIVASVEVVGRTGVEMEAMTAASVAALTVYDMLKALDRAMTLGPTRLLSKSGGRSGDYRAE
jgi:cyclic pyranopterin phosphate synthase